MSRHDTSGAVGLTGIVRDALTAIGPGRRLLVALIGFSLVTGLLETTMLYLVGRLALAVTAGETTVDASFGPIDGEVQASTLAWAAGGIVVALVALSYPTAAIAARLSARTLDRARDRLIAAYLGTEWARRAQDREGHLQELVGQYTVRTEKVVLQLSTLIVVVLSLLMLALGAIVVSPVATGIGLVGFVVLSLLTRPASQRVKRWSTQAATITKEMGSQVAQTTRLGQEVIAFDVRDEVEGELRAMTRASSRAVARVRLISRMTPSLYLYGAFALVIAIMGALTRLDSADVAALGPLMLIFVRGLGYGRQVQSAIQTGLEYSPYIQTLEEEITAMGAAPIRSGSTEVDRLDAIRFEDVGFAYQPGTPVLSDVTCTIPVGTVLGIVGPSGGGKTTFTQLLLRLRHPTTGRILVGDVDAAEVSASSWARLVALVPQDNKLIRATVADNIRFYRPRFSDDAVEAAARAAHLHDEITALPDGYATVVGPGTRALSGGQVQRLGIARALVGDPQLLVLDEPTSALDARSENLIRDTLLEIRERTTLVIVAHRPATIEICDEVLRIDGGHVVRLDDPHGAGTVPAGAADRPVRP